MKGWLPVRRVRPPSPSATLETLEPRRLLSAFKVKVNFQPAGVTPPPGYRVDYGATYARRSNGFSYGWSSDNQNDARDRNNARSLDQAWDTLNHFNRTGQSAKRWEIAVPAGRYRVRVVAGDPSFFNDTHRIAVESQAVVSGARTIASRPFVEGTVNVDVRDGRLTLSPATGAVNPKILFAEITQISQLPDEGSLRQRMIDAFAYAEASVQRTLNDIGNNTSTFVERTRVDGSWKTVDRAHWAAGFLPGAMWQLHGYTGKSIWRDKATAWTTPLAPQVNQTGDLAFKFMTTYLPLYQLSGNPAHRQVLLDAAASKNAQWNSTVGAYRTTWFTTRTGNPRANFAVLMDMTTDMELLIWAGRQTGNQQYLDRAIAHTQKVIANQVRADGSISQFGMYDAADGQFIMQETYQGYSNSSTWSRGQAWAILSFAMMARETGRADFLSAARKVADYWIARVPVDGVPFWDFDHPQIPNTFRDSSAAAIAASGLIDLSNQQSDPSARAKYRAAAEKILASLLSNTYWAQYSIHRGLIQHGAVNVPNDQFGRDNSIIYGDYYLLKALNQHLELG